MRERAGRDTSPGVWLLVYRGLHMFWLVVLLYLLAQIMNHLNDRRPVASQHSGASPSCSWVQWAISKSGVGRLSHAIRLKCLEGSPPALRRLALLNW